MKVSVIGLRGFPSVEGGVEKHCESLYPKLNKLIKLKIYRRKPYVVSNENYKNITFVDLPSTRIKGFEPFFHSLIATICALIDKPDVVHYHNIGPAFFSPLLKIRKIPVILTYHSANYEHKKWNKFAKKFLIMSEKVALKSANKIVFVNKFQMEKYGDDVKCKSIYVPNGLNNLLYTENTNFLDKIGVERNKYILSVGRITPEKGFDTLIKAYKLANKNGYKLVIAGGVEFENTYMKELKKLSENENVIFTGYTTGDNLNQLYSHASLYVLASVNEGFPLVLLEAMEYQLDVLVSNIPATHLVNLEDNDYFDCGDYETLALKISNRLKGIKKRSYDLSDFNWDKIVDIMSMELLNLGGVIND